MHPAGSDFSLSVVKAEDLTLMKQVFKAFYVLNMFQCGGFFSHKKFFFEGGASSPRLGVYLS